MTNSTWAALGATTTVRGPAPTGAGQLLDQDRSRTGIPLHVDLVAAERDSQLHNTNARWDPADPATAQAVAAGVASTAPEAPAPPVPPDDGDNPEGRTQVISADLIRTTTPTGTAVTHRAGDRP